MWLTSLRSPFSRRLSAGAVRLRVGLPTSPAGRVGGPHRKRFVYILKSLAKPDTYYVGLTSNVRRRLESHNEGLSAHTSEHRPWRTLVVIEFAEDAPALEFQRYLKTGSGREFARRHFRQTVRARARGAGEH
jgi:putative endonuclease